MIVGIDSTGSLTAANQAVTVTCSEAQRVAFQLTGTFAGTITFEACNEDTPTNWTACGAVAAAAAASTTQATTATAVGIYTVDCTAFKRVRARCSTYTSGTFVVTATKAAVR